MYALLQSVHAESLLFCHDAYGARRGALFGFDFTKIKALTHVLM